VDGHARQPNSFAALRISYDDVVDGHGRLFSRPIEDAGDDGWRVLSDVRADRKGVVPLAVSVVRVHLALPVSLLAQFGAVDLAGAGPAIGAVTQLGPQVTVLVLAGAGSTAICTDLAD
jgi:hypothetical protein